MHPLNPFRDLISLRIGNFLDGVRKNALVNKHFCLLYIIPIDGGTYGNFKKA